MLTVLIQGMLNHGELSQEDRLVAAVTSNYSMVLVHEGDHELFKRVCTLIGLTYPRRRALAKHRDRK